MKTSTSLTLLAVGGILALALRVHSGFLDVQAAGFILMATGVAGLLVPLWKRGRLQAWWALLTGDLGSPFAGEIDEAIGVHSAGPGSQHPVGLDTQAPDAGFPTIPGVRLAQGDADPGGSH
jgi:hypothetical protein